MKLSELQNAYPALPQSTRQRMLQAARSASGQRGKARGSLRKGAVIALALLLALMGAAYAAARLGIIEYLIGRQEPTRELSRYAQKLRVRDEADGIAVTVTGAVYDGNELALAYEVENLSPENLAMLRIHSVTLGGQTADPIFAVMGHDSWIPSAFGMQELSFSRNPVQGGMKCKVLSQPLNGQQEVVIRVVIQRPSRPLVVVDESLLEPLEAMEDEVQRAERKVMLDGISACGVPIADGGHQDPQWWHDRGYGVLDRSGAFYWPEIQFEEGMSEADHDAMMEEARQLWSQEVHMEETAEMVLRFFIDADKGLENRKEYAFLGEGRQTGEATLLDCTLRLNQFTMTPLSTRLAFDMIPLENTQEAAQALRGTYGWLDLRDANGQELAWADMEYAASNGDLHQDEQGQWLVQWDWTLPGVAAFPQEIHITARAGVDEEEKPTAEQKKVFAAFGEKMRFQMK